MTKAENAQAGLPRLEEQLCFAVYLTGHAFNRLYRTVLAEIGLTYPQYLVMLVLWECDGLPMRTVGERLMLDSGTLTPLLKRMEAAGLIRRERCRDDERQVRLHLTPAGRSLSEKARCVPERLACAVGTTAAENGRMTSDLMTLRKTLLAAADNKS